jgi:hypothetical protein
MGLAIEEAARCGAVRLTEVVVSLERQQALLKAGSQPRRLVTRPSRRACRLEDAYIGLTTVAALNRVLKALVVDRRSGLAQMVALHGRPPGPGFEDAD